MRRNTVRRTAVAASALSLALLVSACGSDKAADAKPEGKEKGKESAAAAPAGKALSQAELDKRALTESDLKDHKVGKATEADMASVKNVNADKAECKPVLDLMTLRPVGTPAASTALKIMSVPQKPAENASPEEKMKAAQAMFAGTITADVLGSYDDKGAADSLAKVRAAGTACAGGFSTNASGDLPKVTKVAPATFSGGDEAVSFTLSTELEGTAGTAHLVVVRKGSTLASFYAQSVMGKAELPKAVIDAQLAKLG
ncbi:hypothetical protein [Streptomyces sp. NPDC053079]|uniref:hypothetical protein n=1 Tax=Streptomyces sp. NPDC053079 TaxID=3365697 RepID=UPI0037D55485